MNNQMPDTLTDDQINSMPDTLNDEQMAKYSSQTTLQPQKTNFLTDVGRGFQQGEKWAGDLASPILGLISGMIGKGYAGTAGGASGGAVGGAVGEAVKTISDPENYKKILEGKGGDVASDTGKRALGSGIQYGALGAMPTGITLPEGTPLLARAATQIGVRGLGGYGAGALGQVGSNIAQGKDIGEGVNEAGFGAAALNEILPLLMNPKSIKLSTQKGVNSLMQGAKDESVKQGVTKSWNDVMTEARQVLNNGQYRFRPDLQREVEQILATKTPAATLTNMENPSGGTISKLTNELNANDLHDLRQALDKSIPKNAWNNPNIRPLGVEANMIVRKIISDSLHEIAPKTQLLDEVNSLYYNPIFNKFGIPKVGSVNSPIPGIPTALGNTLAALLGFETTKKIMKK